MRTSISLLTAAIVTFVMSAAAFGDAPAQADVYRVTSAVRRADPPRFGANMTLGNFSPWSPMYHNIWNQGYAMEPIIFRWTFQATGGGPDYIENRSGQPKGIDPELHRHARSSGAGFWKVFSDGFWDGAQVDIYRAVDGKLMHIRRDRVKRFLSPSRTDAKANPDKQYPEKLILENTGEPVQRGDVYDLLMVRDMVPESVASQRSRQTFFAPMKQTNVQWRIDSTTHAPENGSTASMRIELPGSDEPVGMRQQYLRWRGREVNYDITKPYQLDIWMKDNLDEPVIVQIGDRGTHTVDVPGRWKKFTFALDNSKPITDKVGWFDIKSTGRGTLWLDNMAVYQSDLQPFEILPQWVAAMREFEPGLIRDQGGRTLLTMDNFLVRNQFQRKYIFREGGPRETDTQGSFTLPQLLEFCKATGADPYIMTYILWTDQEIELFMEYLGGPVSTPGGRLRAQHGQSRPWTEVFERIYVECSNEMWNRNFVPQAFPNQPELCGMISDRLFRTMQRSPYATDNFEYVASAFVYSIYRQSDDYEHRGWTYRNLVPAAETATVVATGPSGYIGGWDGATPIGGTDDQLFQANLFYPARVFEPKLDSVIELQEVMTREFGAPQYQFIKYEAGPGYSLPTPQKPFHEEEERVGKSYALGTATLDNFMFVIANSGNTNYYKFSLGNNWASHNMHMMPHNTMQALKLRTYCQGDLLQVVPVTIKTVDLPEVQTVGLDNRGNRRKQMLKSMTDVPLTRVYAFRQGNRYSFLALNRSATETRTIRLEVPYNPQDRYTLHAYVAPSIRSTNRDAASRDDLPITIQTRSGTIDEQGLHITLPPAGAAVLVNHAKDDR